MRLLASILVTAMFAPCLDVHADTIYNYLGPDFAYVAGPDYTTSDFISGSLTLAAPLAPNLNHGLVSFVSYTISDGVQNHRSYPDDTGDEFFFSTDASGDITAFEFFLSVQYPEISVSSYHPEYYATNGSGFGFNYNTFGAFTPAATVTPEPSSFLLFGTGLLGMAAMLKRRLA